MFIPVTTFRIGFCDGQVQQIWILGRGEVSWLFGILGRSEAGCAADLISKLFQKRSPFFLEKKISYFSVFFNKCLAIFNLTGMFGPFFFPETTCEGRYLKILALQQIDDTCSLQPTLRNGIRVTVRCPSLTDSDDAECLQLLDFNKPLPGKHRFFPLFLAHWIVGFRMF